MSFVVSNIVEVSEQISIVMSVRIVMIGQPNERSLILFSYHYTDWIAKTCISF